MVERMGDDPTQPEVQAQVPSQHGLPILSNSRSSVGIGLSPRLALIVHQGLMHLNLFLIYTRKLIFSKKLSSGSHEHLQPPRLVF